MSDEMRGGATLVCAANVPPEELSAWRDGLQAPAQAQWLARHVPGCQSCQSRMRDYERIGAALQQQMIPVPSADPWPAMRRRIAAPRRGLALPGGLSLSSRALWGRVGAGVAALLLVALFAALLARQASLRPSPTTTPTAAATSVPSGAWNVVTGYSKLDGVVIAPSNPLVAYQFSLVTSKTAPPTITMRRTADQGALWTKLTPPAIAGVTYPNITGPVEGFVSPINPQVVYLIIGAGTPTGGCAATGVTPENCEFEFVSANGGQTWRRLTLPAPNLLTGAAIRTNTYSSVAGDLQAQGNRLFGVITTAAALGANSAPPPARLVASDDGGFTWKLIDATFRAAGQGVYTYSAAPDGKAVFAATEPLGQQSTGPVSSAPPLKLWRSMDGGQTWTQLGAFPYPILSDMRAAWDATNNVPVLYLAAMSGGGKKVILGSRGGALSGLVTATAIPSQTPPTLLTTLADGTLIVEASGAVEAWNVTPAAEAAGWIQVAQPDGLVSYSSAFTQTTADGATQLWLTGQTTQAFVAEWAQLESLTNNAAPTVTPAGAPSGSGAVWTKATSLSQVASVAPAILRTQYTAGIEQTSKTSTPQLVLQRSDDWGQTWTNLTPPQIAGVTYPTSVNLAIGQESPVNSQVFILTLQLNGTNYSVCPKNTGRVCQLQYVTANGGASWQQLSLPAPGLLGFGLPLYSASPTIITQGTRLYSAVNQVMLAASGSPPPGRLVVSDDGGVTWKLADSALASRGLFIYALTASPSGSTVYAIAGVTNTNLNPGQLPPLSLWRSDDAGATWTQGGTLPSQNYIAMLAATNPATGQKSLYLLTGVPKTSNATLSLSKDGGVTWGASITIPSPNDPNILLASLPSGELLMGGDGASGLSEWNGTAKTPTIVTQATGIERVDSVYVTPLKGTAVRVLLIGHDRNGTLYYEYTQLSQ